MQFDEKTIRRFWSHVDKSGTHGSWNGTPCWIWNKCTDDDGYGSIRIGNKTYLSHRISFEITNGDIMPNKQVLHHCDNPPCCNPDHLFQGTHADNMRDMASKGRSAFQVHPEMVKHLIETRKHNPQHGDNHYMRRNPENAERVMGRNNPQAKLSDEQVIQIRNIKGMTHKEIANKYGVCRQLISQIIRRIIWKHI